MELTLNLVWLCVAALMLWQWQRLPSRDAAHRRVQIVGLVMVIMILLPAISITDDLLAAQNPAEIDTCVRRNHDAVQPHVVFPATAALTAAQFSPAPLGTLHDAAPRELPPRTLNNPACDWIENRPPPAA